jgi:hypothetical protein
MGRIAAAALAATMALAITGPAAAEDLRFKVVNNSSLDVEYFYASPSNESNWGGDLLGSGRLGSYSYGTATIADGSTQCVYDFKYIMSDGQTYYEDSIDLCSLGTYTISE